jgi:regulator of replication initiation timing
MSNEEILSKLKQVEGKLQQLIIEHSSLKKELKASIEENNALKDSVERQNQDLKNFQNQDKISKIVSSMAEDTQKNTELKLKINEYIKEIDKCIAHLSE